MGLVCTHLSSWSSPDPRRRTSVAGLGIQQLGCTRGRQRWCSDRVQPRELHGWVVLGEDRIGAATDVPPSSSAGRRWGREQEREPPPPTPPIRQLPLPPTPPAANSLLRQLSSPPTPSAANSLLRQLPPPPTPSCANSTQMAVLDHRVQRLERSTALQRENAILTVASCLMGTWRACAYHGSAALGQGSRHLPSIRRSDLGSARRKTYRSRCYSAASMPRFVKATENRWVRIRRYGRPCFIPRRPGGQGHRCEGHTGVATATGHWLTDDAPE